MHSNLVRALVVAAAALAVMGGIAFATGRQPGSSRDSTITACVRPDGKLRIAGTMTGCRKDETVLRWGITGPAGPVGGVGPTGRTGPTGPAGARGDRGTLGPTGPAGGNGNPGPAGAIGPAGPMGAEGAPGAQGLTGAAGAVGAAGAPGPQGPVGARGAAGPTGPRGVAGAGGPTGAAGPRGFAGSVGPTGAVGPRGIASGLGPTGPTGSRGAEGPPGPAGPKGDAGPALSSFDQLAGLACGSSGTITIAFDAAGHATFTCVAVTPPTGGETGVVRVNEVATGTAAAAAEEFVELVNTASTGADIGGWKLVYRSATGTSDVTLATIPAGTTLAAGAFYVFGGSAYTGPPAADQSFGTGLAATGGAVGVRDSGGALVDGVGWGTAANALVETAAAPAPPATTPGSSIVRLPDGHDTGSNATDFTVTANPTPRASNH